MPDLIIAEDNPDLAQALRRKAEQLGWQVTLCRDGAELLTHMDTLRAPALVVIDVNMPNIDGIEAIRHMGRRHVGARLRIRFMTGGPNVNALAAKMIADANDFDVGHSLFKPFSLTTFADMLGAEAALLADGR